VIEPSLQLGGPHEPGLPLPASGASKSNRRVALLLIVLFLLAVAPYLNTLLNGFVYDDDTQVLNNPYILNFSHLRAIFTTTAWSYIGHQGLTNYYRPLMTFGYLACHELFGMLAYGFHLANILFYAASTLVLFAVTARMFKRHDVAFVAAALFALHPVHTESVAWIAAVTGLELILFYLLAFWFFLRLPQTDGRRSDGAMLGMMMSFLLALLSKEQAMTFPALATFYEYACREDRHETSWSGKLARYGPLWLLLAAYVLFRVRVLGGFAPINQLPRLSWTATFFSAFALMAHYVGKLFWPVRLCAFYVFHPSSSLADPRVLAGVLVMVAGIALFFWSWKRSRQISFALLWFAVTLAPVLNARWMAANVFAERYLDLPSVGFCWLVGWWGINTWDALAVRRSRFRPLLVAVACLVAVAAAARIVTRNRDWRDDVSLYAKTLSQSPNAYEILNNLGTVYWHRGQMEKAQRCWERALELRPGKEIFLNNMGLYYAGTKQYAEAESYYWRAIRAKPDYTDAHFNLGSLFRKEGKWKQAELQLQAAIALSPLNSDAHNEMAELYLATHRAADAEVQFKESIAATPNVPALDGLGEMEMQAARFGEAKRDFERALELDSHDSEAHFGMAEVDASAGLDQEAIMQYEAGLRSDPKNALAQAALEKLKSNGGHGHSSPH
jgi:protein O-mannosyl-transferase